MFVILSGAKNLVMTPEFLIYLIPLFFMTALIYASVGFAGGSTYLALLVLFDVPYEIMPKIALLCNVVVAFGGLYHFFRERHLVWSHVLPFVISSIPFAYLGGRVAVGKKLFLVLLGLSLACAGLRLLFSKQLEQMRHPVIPRTAWNVGLPIGAVLGFLSGLVGIGGGIFLSPILYFLGWGNGRQIAASACFFICVNSLFGLIGQFAKGGLTGSEYWIGILLAVVFIGGQIGSRLGSRRLSFTSLQRITAGLILFVAVRIFWELA